MAAKKAAAGLAVIGIGAILLYALSAQAEEPKPEVTPETGGPKPLPEPGKCVRTRPGEKGEAVIAWQRCLIEAGCLAKGEDDGIHGPITEEASNNFASGVPCATPLKTPGRDGGKKVSSSKDRIYYLNLSSNQNDPSQSASTVRALRSGAGVNAVKEQFKKESEEFMKDPQFFARNKDGMFYMYSTALDQKSDVRSHGSWQITTVTNVA